MHFKRILSLLILILLFAGASYADSIVVTVNADAGPGTLREALSKAAANGNTTQDIISFNLSGSLISDRTIRLKSQLPLVTANVVIDGTTQPGGAFGVSDSKVIIEPETSPAYFSALVIIGDYNTTTNITQGVEIYGLYIRNFAKINNLVTYDSTQGSGIYIQGNSSGIKIGAPGKGNVICGTVNAIYSDSYYYYTTNSGDITIQSNIIGLADDGKTAISNISGISLPTFSTITIGGTDANMGNTIAANVNGLTIPRSNYYYTTLPQTVNIQNNKIGTDFTGTVDYKQNPLFVASSFIKTYGINIVSSNCNVNISGNIVSGQIGYGIFISYANFTITNNKIGTDITGVLDLGNYEGIRSDVSATGIIGGSSSIDKNYIGHNNYGIEVANSKQVLITQNSIFCNTGFGISEATTSYQIPFVQVLTFHSDMVSGIATANSTIELFFSDDCGFVNCQGKDYITTVQSDGSGKWSYSGTIGKTVVATATNAQKNTSPFSSLKLMDSEPVIKQYTCAYSGSVTIPQMRDGILFHWDKKEDNGTLTAIVDAQNVDQLLPGIYQLTIQYPGGCQKVTQLFEIKDQRVKIQNVIPPVPQCRQKTFPVDVNYQGGTGNVVFKWVNDQGVTAATGKATSVPAGTYKLHITDDAGCDVTSDPITIIAKPGPDYNLNTMQVHTAECGVSDGYIKNITTSVGIGTLSYSWKNDKGVEVGTDKDLVNVPGGMYYSLTLIDQSECSPYNTTSIYIGQTNSVFIGDAAITQPKCDLNNGAILLSPGAIVNASVFKWYGPNGAELTSYQNKLSLTNLAEGNYTLTAINPVTNCSNSRTFAVNRIPRDVYSFSPNVKAATCGLNNGSITLSFNGIAPANYTWTNDSGNPVGNGASIKNMAPGIYTLSVNDRNGCSTPVLGQYTIVKTSLLAFDASNNPTPHNDQCDQQLGSITGIVVTGGVQPYTYTWTDANAKVVGANNPTLSNVGPGNYILTVTDATACGMIPPLSFVVGNDKYIPPAPALANQRICTPGVVTLYVKNSIAGTYKLYENATTPVPIMSNTKGEFTFAVKQTGDYYVTYNVGSCESPRTKVNVEVVSVDISMPNTITPNGDSINDNWKITGLQKFPGTTVQVFTRTGKLVFDSKEYPTPFDGTYKGKPLPAGVYYYVININIPCNIISGNLTLVR